MIFLSGSILPFFNSSSYSIFTNIDDGTTPVIFSKSIIIGSSLVSTAYVSIYICIIIIIILCQIYAAHAKIYRLAAMD